MGLFHQVDSDEMTYLRAMQRAMYVVCVVDSVDRGLGTRVHNLLSDWEGLLVDVNLSANAIPNLVIATRLFLQDGFAMTSGAALPLGVAPPRQQEIMAEKLRVALRMEDETIDPADLIREALQAQGSHVRFAEPGEDAPVVSEPVRRQPSLVGRNDPCPCGSGKKYKKCCLR